MELWWWKAGEPECFTKDFLFFFFTAFFSFPPGHSNLQVYTRQTTAEFLRVDSLQLLNVASRGLTRFDLKAQSTSPVEINEKSSLCSSLFPSNELYIYIYICVYPCLKLQSLNKAMWWLLSHVVCLVWQIIWFISVDSVFKLEIFSLKALPCYHAEHDVINSICLSPFVFGLFREQERQLVLV